MPPGRPPGRFSKPKWSQNHQKWEQKWSQQREIAPFKKSKIFQWRNEGNIQGNRFLKQKCRKPRNLKMLIFHWFLQYNMHVRPLHALSKLKLARARMGHRKHIKNEYPSEAKNAKNLWKFVKTQHRNEIHPKNLFRTSFSLILAWFWRPRAASKSPKMTKKTSRKHSKK